MKKIKYNKIRNAVFAASLILPMLVSSKISLAQIDISETNSIPNEQSKPKPVKNTFEGNWIIDNQSVMVPVKGTLEADIQHRFGSVQNGFRDLWGVYNSANIRFGFSYSPIKNLNLGFGLTKSNMQWDGSAKYAIIKQTKGVYPVSVTYYGNIGYKSVKDPSHFLFMYNTQRLSYFNEIMVARKFSEKLSVQVAGTVSHQNSVPGFYAQKDTTIYVFKEGKFDLFAFSICARYKITKGTSFIIDYDQPLTRFATNNPSPNFAFGFEFSTSGHSFQLFAGNYNQLNPQQNSLYNKNNPFAFTQTDGSKVPGGQFCIGFNITRLWNF